MSSTSTTRLGLFKATPGTGEAFRTSDLNSNWDKVDAEAVAADGRLDVIEAAQPSHVTLTGVQTLTNKTLTAPVLSAATGSLSAATGSLSAPTLTGTTTAAAINMSGNLKLPASTGSGFVPLSFTAGTVGVVSAQSLETDSNVLYYSPNSAATNSTNGGRAVVATPHYYHMNGNYGYTPSLTNATFNSSGTSLTLAANTLYEIEAIVRYQFTVSTTATASTTKINYTGTFSSVESTLTYNYATSVVGFSTGTGNQGQATVPVNGVVTTSAAATSSSIYCTVLIKGSLRTTTSGALQLQTIYSQLTGLSATVTIGSSFMKVTPIGSANAVSLGAWA